MGTIRSTIKISTYRNLVIALVFLIAGVIIIALMNHFMKQEALKEAETKARIILDRNLAIHAYFNHDLKPKLFAFTNPYRPRNHFEPTWMSSTYAVREIDMYARNLTHSDYYYKECAVNARSPENEADEYERAFIASLNRDAGLIQRSEVRTFQERPYFVVLRRGETLESSCLRCHSTPQQAPADLVKKYGAERSFNRNAGEVISAISIRVPLTAAYTEANRFSLMLSVMLLAVLIVLFVVQAAVSQKLIFSPLKKIRDKAILISTDENHLGETIAAPPGQELRDLTSSFNTMSVNLRQGRDNLEEQVIKRTAELQKALDNVKTLSGLLPICASCSKVRNDKGYWDRIEDYVREHSDAEFSHGLCPECAAKLYPDYYKKKET